MDDGTEMDAFCGSKFWDTNLTWTTEDPDFTACFQRTVLIWAPCAFLWAFSSLEAVYLINSRNRNVPWNALNLSKLAVTFLLSIVCLADFGYAVNRASNEENVVFNVHYYTPFILLVSFCLAGVFTIYNRMRGMTASGLLFFFWLFMAIFGIVQYRSEIRHAIANSDYSSSYYFVSYMIYYPLIVIQFLLHCFADQPPIFSEFPPAKNPCPELLSSSLSRQLFSWFDGLAWLGFRKPLEPSDLWSMNPEDTSAGVVPRFDKFWNKSVQSSTKKFWNNFGKSQATASFRRRGSNVSITGQTPKKKYTASILWPLCRAFGPTFLFGSLLKVMNDCLTFVNPHILELLIGFIQGGESEWKGYMYAALLLLVASLQTIILSQYFYRMMLVGVRTRTALISAIYRKSLRMSNASRKESTVGEIVNLMSVDAQRFMELTTYLNMIWSAPLQIALALYFLWDLLGPSVLAGLAVMIILIPINGVIANKTKTLQIKQMKNKDERVKMMNEVLSGIKVLKLYAWEPSFEEQILKVRNKEINVLREAAYLNAGTSFIWSCAPFLVSVVTLATYVLLDASNPINASVVFVSLTYFNLLRFPMSMLPQLITFLVQVGLVSYACYVLMGNDLTAQSAFVSLSYFNILRMPMMALPQMISLMIQMSFFSLWTFVLLGNELTATAAFVSMAFFNVLNFTMAHMPILIVGIIQVSLVSFATYVLSDSNNVLDSQKAFVSLSYFNILRFPLSMLPMMISQMVQASVSVKRINKFLNCDELDPNDVTHDDNDQHPLAIENGSFSWGPEEPPTLKNINLHLKPGQLAAVVGTVGSGKSSLISAFLGEMDKNSGRVNTRGSIAYVSQQAWIQNATLRENILFGKSLEHSVYTRIVDACALKPDLEMLPGGDQTEIGEKGINLSGGQKQRVNLARAVYANSEVYFLDDPLSAVDSHVGKHIFDNVIGPSGILRKKTRLLVTHSITYLPEVDVIIVLKDGMVSETGTYKELLERKGAFAEFLIAHLQDNEDVSEIDLEDIKTQLEGAIGEEKFRELQRQRSETKSESGSVGRRTSESSLGPIDGKESRKTSVSPEKDDGRKQSSAVNGSAKPAKDKLIEIEKAETGSVKWRVYSHYLRSIGVWLSVGTLVMNMIYQGFSIGSNFWLSEWSDASSAAENSTLPSSDRDMYLGVYGALGIGQAITMFIGSLTVAQGCVVASKVMHDAILSRCFLAPMSFFDTTPAGRIVNRFAKDIDIVDNILPVNLRAIIIQLFSSNVNFKTAAMLGPQVAQNDGDGIELVSIVAATFIYFAYLMPFMGCLRASRILHQTLLRGIFSAPTQFFDTVPIGRILARFAADVEAVDSVLPWCFCDALDCGFEVVATVVVISYTTPIFIAVIVPIGALYYFIQRFYVATSRQLKRIESVSRSPIYSHFGESVSGAQTIRAYNVQHRFIRESEEKVDFNQVCYYPSMIANRWLAIRLEMIGNMIIFFAALFAVINRETMNPGLVGLSVTYALQITQTLNWLVRMTSEVETNIVAVERIKEYGETPQEAAWDIPDNKPALDWPSKGEVEFKNYQVRYREGLDLVLKGLNFTVKGGEKVGIVGRTGAGKSSLTLGLFRIIEPAGGTIMIDGVDVSKLGLHDLRARLTIIPQDPVLFSGTIRLNLDPFGTHTDQEVWQALEHAHLKGFISQLTLGLEHEVSEGGENLSVGQRQLICLARALLRKTKLLILDEATAAVDLETDDLIQRTIRSEFKNCTVLTIAHRLNTILDSDRVVVLDKGLIVEYDSPHTLLSKPKSVFAGMAKDAGITSDKKKS